MKKPIFFLAFCFLVGCQNSSSAQTQSNKQDKQDKPPGSDIIPANPVVRPEFLYDKVAFYRTPTSGNREPLQEFRLVDAIQYCANLGARLPTPREVIAEFEVAQKQDLTFPTAFSHITSKDPNKLFYDHWIPDENLKVEFEARQAQNFGPVFAYDSTQDLWHIEYYFSRELGYRVLAEKIEKAMNLPAGSVYVRQIFTNVIDNVGDSYVFKNTDGRFWPWDKYVRHGAICVKDRK